MAQGNFTFASVGAGTTSDPGGEGRIEAPHLQLVMTRIWSEEEAAGSKTLRRSTIESLGGAENIIRAHLDEAMASLPPEDQDLAAVAFHHLVTPSGSKIAMSAEDLASYAHTDSPALTAVLEDLAASNRGSCARCRLRPTIPTRVGTRSSTTCSGPPSPTGGSATSIDGSKRRPSARSKRSDKPRSGASTPLAAAPCDGVRSLSSWACCSSSFHFLRTASSRTRRGPLT